MTPYFIFLIPVSVFVLTQLIKFIRLVLKYGVDKSYLLSPGHMPSAHAAGVTSLVMTVAYFDSITSSAFVVAMVLALIVINDAMRLRMEISNQARQLNVIVEKMQLDRGEFPRLKEHVGHYGKEVFAGIITGVALTAFLIWWSSFLA